jgi:hypothetical protein
MKAKRSKVAHVHGGNCWNNAYACRKCGRGNLCDVCHTHDLPRGLCRKCPKCPACERIGEPV